MINSTNRKFFNAAGSPHVEKAMRAGHEARTAALAEFFEIASRHVASALAKRGLRGLIHHGAMRPKARV